MAEDKNTNTGQPSPKKKKTSQANSSKGKQSKTKTSSVAKKTKPSLPYNAKAVFIRKIVERELSYYPKNVIPDPDQLVDSLIDTINTEIETVNVVKGKGRRWKCLEELPPYAVAAIIMYFYTIKRIALAGLGQKTEMDLLSVYQTKGFNKGIYVSDDELMNSRIRSYNEAFTDKQVAQVVNLIRGKVPRVEANNFRDYIPVDNGIIDYRKKQLEPFDPEKVFTRKCHIPYNPFAKNPVIHNDKDGTDWDIESWMKSLFDVDDGRPELMWQMLGAAIRPNVSWNRSFWLTSSTGCNGKGCVLQLVRSLVGEGAYAKLSLSEMSEEFKLTELIGAMVVTSDENSVGKYIDDCANFKEIVTADNLLVNRKHKTPITMRFHGLVIECFNDWPRIHDKTLSFFRRQIQVPFDKSFLNDERKYIKDDYLLREEVLEYVLWRVINMKDYYDFDIPDSCKVAQDDYMIYNDPVRQFADDMMPRLQWDFVPSEFIWDLYVSWSAINNPGGQTGSRNKFISDLKTVLDETGIWQYHDKNHKVHTGAHLAKPEHLIKEFDLKHWYNKTYNGKSDIDRLCLPSGLKPSYTGFLKKVQPAVNP